MEIKGCQKKGRMENCMKKKACNKKRPHTQISGSSHCASTARLGV